MCLSPHEMTSASIEEHVAEIEDWLANGKVDDFRSFWEGRVENFRKLLKERADNGTYHTAGEEYS